MSISLLRSRLLETTMVAGALLAASAAVAQDTGTPPGQTSPSGGVTSPVAPIGPGENTSVDAAGDSGGGVIVVTGSRIAQPNLTSASPITVVNSAEIKLQGATRIEDVLNTLPQAFAQQSSSVSNGSNGTATANLRNLGDSRTLVLINGRRLMPGAPSSGATASSAADLNVIPAALVKRVDVLTGGASAVYGSDAIAGVVNFVMDTDYEGVSVDSSYGLFVHDNNASRFQALNAAKGYPFAQGNTVDGRQFDVSIKLGAGTSDGRGHVVGYAGYRKIDGLQQSERDYSSCGLSPTAAGFACSGSPNAAPANFSNLLNGDSFGVTPAGTLNAGNLYNANPLNYYQRPDKRYTAGFFANYEVSDALKTYAEFNFMDDRTVAQIAPSGLFSGSGSVSSINCDNPLLSAAERTRICAPDNLVLGANGAVATFLNPNGTPYTRGAVTIGRRDVEGGGRQADFRHTSYRLVTGAKGDLAPGISYDVYGQFGSTVFNQIYRNEFSLTRATRALDVITDTRAGSATLGQPVCRSVVDGSDPACAPLNVFNGSTLSGANLAYVLTSGFQSGEAKEKVVSGSVTVQGSNYGVQTPWAKDGIALNVGAEYRKESVRLEVDQAFASGDLTGQGGPTQSINGSFNVKEAFAEVSIPLVSDVPFLYELSLDGGYRYSKYSTAGSVSSYKGEAVWAPVRDVKLRAGYNRAVRAPNTQELFAAQVLGLGGSFDPCTGATPEYTQQQCARTGVTAAQYGSIRANPSAQYNDIEGGNTNLKPEKADTITVGLVFQPSFLRGFSASVDAFSIKIKNLVGIVGADTIVSQCGLNGDAALCSLIHRDATGSLWISANGYTLNTNVNTGSLKTRGIDTNLAYTLRTDNLGVFGLSFTGTYVDELRSKKAGADFDCAGLYGGQCGFPQSKWKHTARVTWTLPNGVGISGRWRYLSRVRYEKTSTQADLAGGFQPVDAQIKAQSYFDLALTARVAQRYSLRLGANNLLDRDPPILSQTAAPISSFGNGNTYPGTYDAAGRYVFVGLTVDL